MSTLKVNRLEHTSTTSGGITIDNTGAVSLSELTLGGEQLSTGGTFGNRNLIVNGGMKVAQRQGVISNSVLADALSGGIANGYHDVDRWYYSCSACAGLEITHSQEELSASDVVATGGQTHSCKVDVTAASTTNASSIAYAHQYSIEGQDLQQLQYGSVNAKDLTLSFWVKVSDAGTYVVRFKTDNGSGSTFTITRNFTIGVTDTNTWRQKQVTIPGITNQPIRNDIEAGMTISWVASAGSDFKSFDSGNWAFEISGGDAYGQTADIAGNADGFYEITGVQLEAGNKKTSFEHKSYQDELTRCLRYCQRTSFRLGTPMPMYSTSQYTAKAQSFQMAPVRTDAVATSACTDMKVVNAMNSTAAQATDTSCSILLDLKPHGAANFRVNSISAIANNEFVVLVPLDKTHDFILDAEL